MKLHKHLLVATLVVAFALAGALYAYTGDDDSTWHGKLAWQGRLEQNGNIVDHAVDLTARLYDVSSGGSALWSDSYEDVPVDEGVLALVLGEGNAIPTYAFSRQGLYLELAVDGVTLAPRQQVYGAAFASYAAQPFAPGIVLPYAGDPENLPAGFLACDGSEVSRTEFAALYAAIGTRHGDGDGSTTFTLPDYRGRFLRGADLGAGRDPERTARTPAAQGGVAGDAVGSVQGEATRAPANSFYAANAGSHTHTNGSYDQLMILGSRSGSCGRSFSSGDNSCDEPDLALSADMLAAGTHSHAVSGGDLETRPENASVHYLIKY